MNRDDLQRLSRLRVREARTLLNSGHFSGAYYLLGYAVECALKACIAKQIKRYDFPDRKLITDSYTHNLEKLLSIAGLEDEFERESKENPSLGVNWVVVKEWSEQARYQDTVSESKAREFYSACTARKHGVLSWLKKWW